MGRSCAPFSLWKWSCVSVHLKPSSLRWSRAAGGLAAFLCARTRLLGICDALFHALSGLFFRFGAWLPEVSRSLAVVLILFFGLSFARMRKSLKVLAILQGFWFLSGGTCALFQVEFVILRVNVLVLVACRFSVGLFSLLYLYLNYSKFLRKQSQKWLGYQEYQALMPHAPKVCW